MKIRTKDYRDLAWLLRELARRTPEIRELVDEAGGYNNPLLRPFYEVVDEEEKP